MKSLPLLMFLLLSYFVNGQNCNCEQEFNFLVNKIENDYAGFQDKVNNKNIESYKLFTENIRIQSRKTNSFLRCTIILEQWLKYFNDKHLSLEIDKNIYFTYKRFDSTALLLRIPSFSWHNKEIIDSLVLKNKAQITSTPILIIDLRGNSGGTDYSYLELLPLIYANPYVTKGVEWWASQGNIEFFETAVSTGNIKKGKEDETKIFLDSLKKHLNTFVQIEKSDTIRRDTIYQFPQLVGIIVDDYCASSCEQFVLSAKNSSKSIIFGTRTLGVLDYSNVVPEKLLTQGLKIRYPMTRSTRLPEQPIDNIGIVPDIEINLPINLNIKSEIDDWIIFVNDYLKKKIK